MPSTMDRVNIWYGANGSETEERTYPVALGALFKRGDLVTLCDNGVRIGTEDRPALGIALADSIHDTVPVAIAAPNLRWVLPTAGETKIGMAGKPMGLGRDAAAKWYATANGTPKVIITAIHPQYPIGEKHGWVEVKFIESQVAYECFTD